VAVAGVKDDLIKAAGRGDFPEVKRLLAKGADVNAKDDLGMTALILASGLGHREVVQLLLDKGADVNTMSKTNRTALGDASMNGRKEIREMLIKAGADPGTEQAWRKYHLPPPEKLPGVR
jgi:ankyrin repeat protein